MKQKIKLNLTKLKVQSFVTSLTNEEKNIFMGAGSDDKCDTPICTQPTCGPPCSNGSFCATCFPSACSGNCC